MVDDYGHKAEFSEFIFKQGTVQRERLMPR